MSFDRRQTYLDLLRGLAVVSVVSVHSLQIVNAGKFREDQFNWLNVGQYGVELFFMISGWLMYWLYGNTQNFSTKMFVRRRLARIYPLWILFVVIGLAINSLNLNLFFGTVTNNYRFSDNISLFLASLLGFSFTLWLFAPFWNSVVPGGWSIQCEVYNYLLFSILRKYPLERVMLITCIANICSFTFSKTDLVIANGMIHEISAALNRLNILNSFSYFLLGALVHKIYERFSIHKIARGSNRTILSQVALLPIFIFSVVVTPIAFGNQLHCLFYVLGSLLLCGYLRRFVVIANVLSTLGKYSYSIYFTHFYLLSAILYFKPNILFDSNTNIYISWIMLQLITLLTAYLLGMLSWKYLESPINRKFR